VKIAVTGGTGFVGSHLIEQAVMAGYAVRALTRRPQPAQPGITWIAGSLEHPASLSTLVEGCAAVVHVAGVVKGDRAAFRKGNLVGTEAMLEAAAQAGIRRFVHVSSLAAREPQLSAYGWSKCASEEPVIASGGDWTIIRPAVIYGPRDTELLALFRAARFGVVPLPTRGRTSVIAAEDLARLMLACLADRQSFHRTYEPGDGMSGGWSQIALAEAIGAAIGRKVRTVIVPGPLLRAVAFADSSLRRGKAKLTRDRAGYYTHPDWVGRAQPPAEVWTPQIETRAGLAATAKWYRAEGLL
jgi:uncharacterized protein YbjT (DUF2867 family)